ncbi:adenine phosphoribosyltransferase [Allostreptomyces psammosilenae]|uniref:Adenine phosphoribosyltransferase n=1 Tax=Allostreptomyces psammosilenae TaxID=1892865 RepID=A0A852ZRN1_9ACTN|nr:adenine phosphoribosyltransferase [Allostreptomyces psammosilenae]NYI05019.1 adenine phosphoribosyltransferase [Allostreptomyces psammosilenae]
MSTPLPAAARNGADAAALWRARIRDVPDHPRPGVVFKDITPLLADAEAFGTAVEAFADIVARHDVQAVLGLEARGFILGAPVALRTGIGFVPARKAGKLPGPVHREAYQLEYGTAEVEVQHDALAPGQRVLVLDDVLATGGTAGAAIRLVRRCGAEPVAFAVLLELGFLGGRERLAADFPDLPVEALLTS